MASNTVTIKCELDEKGVVTGVKSIKSSLNEVEKADENLNWSGVKEGADAANKTSEGFTIAKGVLANLATAAITAAADAVKNAASSVVEIGTSFETSMSKVSALSGATGDELGLLEAKARELGSTTTFSASEAADALGYMALAGWSTEDMLNGVSGVLSLAQAGEMDLASASDLVTDYLSAFNMTASDTTRMVDVLSYAQANANTTVDGLGAAFKNCAANCNAAGMDVETTSAAISMMANQGLKGSEAGTALNAVMRDMTSNMEDGAIAIGDAKVQIMDSEGNYRDFADILADVESATDGMGDAQKAAALQSTFTADSIKGLNLMLNAGSDSLVDFRDDLYNCSGAAADTAATMTDNLGGDVASMNSAFEELSLKVWDVVEGPLRELVQFITTDVAGGLSSLIEWLTTPTQQFDEFGNVVGEVASPLQQFLDTLDALKPVIVAVVAAIAGFAAVVAIQAIISGIAGAFTLLWTVLSANPIGVIIGLIAAVVAAIKYLWDTNEDFRNTVMEIWQAISDFFTTVFQTISDTFNTVWTAISDFVLNTWNTIYDNVSFVVGLVLAIIVAIFTAVSDFVTTVWNAIYEAISGPLNTAYNVVSSIISTIQSVISTVFNAIKSFVTTVWNAIYNFIATPIQNAYNTVSSVIGTIQSVVSSVFNAIKSTVTSVWNGIKSAIETPINAARDLVKGAIDSIKGFFNFSISWPHIPMPHFGISPSGWKIGDLLTGSIPTLAINWYATGGVFNSPSVIGVGEAGSEAVVPLQGKYMQPFAQAVSDNIDGNGSDTVVNLVINIEKFVNESDKDIDELTKTIAEKLQTLLNRKKRSLGAV